MARRRRFNPAEPRDIHGKWVKGSGATSRASYKSGSYAARGTRTYSQPVRYAQPARRATTHSRQYSAYLAKQAAQQQAIQKKAKRNAVIKKAAVGAAILGAAGAGAYLGYRGGAGRSNGFAGGKVHDLSKHRIGNPIIVHPAGRPQVLKETVTPRPNNVLALPKGRVRGKAGAASNTLGTITAGHKAQGILGPGKNRSLNKVVVAKSGALGVIALGSGKQKKAKGLPGNPIKTPKVVNDSIAYQVRGANDPNRVLINDRRIAQNKVINDLVRNAEQKAKAKATGGIANTKAIKEVNLAKVTEKRNKSEAAKLREQKRREEKISTRRQDVATGVKIEGMKNSAIIKASTKERAAQRYTDLLVGAKASGKQLTRSQRLYLKELGL